MSKDDSSTKTVVLVAGARPNFLKVFPILRALEAVPGLRSVVVNTGQHYDHSLAQSFFELFGVRSPDYNLHVGSASHAVQTANIMVRFETVCEQEKPAFVVVVGDVNSTVAAGLVAKKCGVGLAHVEAGLRSNDRSMPEEINRLATDAIADQFFTTEEDGTANLIREGHPAERIHFVGNIMIDSLFEQLHRIRSDGPPERAAAIRRRLPEKYICMTLHRPSNVDDPAILAGILGAVKQLSGEVPVIFPVHPRTQHQIERSGLLSHFDVLRLDETGIISTGFFATDSLAYNEFLSLWKDAAAVLTDSGGLQEETTALKVPCLTLRENTERPITERLGTNRVVGTNPEDILFAGRQALRGEWKNGTVPPLWDGRTGERIAKALARILWEEP